MRGIKALKIWLLFITFFFSVFSKSEIHFYIPPCFPDCNRADMESMILSGEREQEIIRVLDSAQKSIYFSMYTFSRRPIFEALIRAVVDRGVELKGIIDQSQLTNVDSYCDSHGKCQFEGLFGSEDYLKADLNQRYEMAINSNFFKRTSLAEKLILLFYQSKFNVTIKSAPGRDRIVHNKFALIDRAYLMAGSGNWSYTAMSVNMENLEFTNINENPNLVESFQCAFELFWEGDGLKIRHLLNLCEIPSYVYFTPAPPNREGIYQQIIRSIDSSEQTINISMHHLVHEDVVSKLGEAANRGVKIRILLDDDDCMKKSSMSKMLTQYLTHQNVDIRYAPTNCQLFQLSHNKYGIFDNNYVINGAGNWSLSGLHENYEFFILYSQLHEVNKFIQNFEFLWSFAKPKPQCGCDPSNPDCRRRFCI